MKRRHLPNKIAGVILGFAVLCGIGPGGSAYGQDRRNRRWDGYPNWGGSYDLRQTALNAGYNEGSTEGRRDRVRGRHSDYSSFSAFQKATKVYSPRLGDRELYRRYFQLAFSRGYETENPGQIRSDGNDRDSDRDRNRDNNRQGRGRNWD